jgi:3-methyladenine DNA glycosylase AlkD
MLEAEVSLFRLLDDQGVTWGSIMEPGKYAATIIQELESLPVMKTAPMRRVRREFSKQLKDKDAAFIIEVASKIILTGKHRWIAYELIYDHKHAFQSLEYKVLEELGQGIGSWAEVDSFARTLSGPAWRDGLISEDTIRRWALSDDRWWRRAALVSTVALNVRSHGGYGDATKTLEICTMLVGDHDDMVVKALSWALRELIVHDPDQVRDFLVVHDAVLAARVKREVRNKLDTGLKNP